MLQYNEFKISLIRHGESEVNVNPDLMGQLSTVALTDKGRGQAKLLHDRFQKYGEKFDLIWSSPYTRAIDTAKIAIGSDHGIHLADELREYDAGDWTGASRSTTLNEKIRLQMNYLNHAFQPPKGESLNQVERRAASWLEENILYNSNIISYAENRKNNCIKPLNIAIFSHGMTIKCLLHYIMGFDRTFTWKISIDNTSVTKLSFGKEGWKIHCINDCSHLL